ncbi:SUKH-4 family immunity protein [Streptomyces sp. NPDC096153]|uniref:SUKH-4 family immunity protein n=1 Tax=Streptomyces sp. NPDC096153 TaxID=3155548 RepID=UPI00332B8CAF
MTYEPQFLTTDSWDEAGTLGLEAAVMPEVDGRPAPVREALDVAREYGLPTEVYGMFYPSSHGGAFSPVSTGNVAAGPFWRLGQHEAQLGDSYVSEYALDEKGRVVLLGPSGPEPRFVNSSPIAFLDALAAWDHRNEHLDDFDHLEPEDDEDEDDPAEAARIAFGMEIARKLAEQDPAAFTDKAVTWWDRVYEEVENDVI